MNERIKELVYQAEKISRQTVVDSKYKTSFNDIFNEKFAELIVKECVECLTDAENWQVGSEALIYNVKKHFGVE